MTKKTDEHIDAQCHAERPDVLDGDRILHAVLPELDAARENLDLLSRQLDEQYSNANKGLCDTRCLKLSAVIGSMAEGVVMINQEGTIEIANPVAKNLLGLPAESSLSNVKTAMENLGMKHLFAAKCRAHSKKEGEFMGKTAAGKILQIKWNAISDGSNRLGGHVIVMRDTTAQVELDRAQTEFIAAISHELRTPLTTMQNSVSNMLAGITGKINPKMNQYLNAMQSDCHRLARLINDLLDMAKLEAGKMHISRSATNLVDLAAKAVEGFSKCAAEKDLSLELRTGESVSRVYVDSQRIYQVFSNLITNAIQYTDRGGKISVSLFEREDEVVSVVEDTGIGIAADQQRHIFNKFYQIGRQAGAGYKGSGLGLSLSSEIIAVHGGKIWVESEPAKGSKFYFSLPKTKPQIVLSKHLEALADRANKRGERFALMVVRLETPPGSAEQNKQAFEAAMKAIMLVGDEITMANGDLIVRLKESEAAIVLSQTGKRYLMHVKRRLRNAIHDALMDYRCNCSSILPMLGVAFYPSDASTVDSLKNKAMSELNKF